MLSRKSASTPTIPEPAMSVRSMTGQGQGTAGNEFGTVACELRTVNHRGVKISARVADPLSTLQPVAEAALRRQITRGSMWAEIRWEPINANSQSAIDWDVAAGLIDGLTQLAAAKNLSATIELTGLLAAPGVVGGTTRNRGLPSRQIDAVTQTMTKAIEAAGADLDQMRRREGAAMVDAITGELAVIADRCGEISRHAPGVIARYEQRLTEKIEAAVERHGLSVPAFDLVREVQVFADRADISEELTRLASHRQMFAQTLADPPAEGVGRKLEFVIQEINRETNTIGSKASDAAIAAEVVEIKCGIERIRELVLNLQ